MNSIKILRLLTFGVLFLFIPGVVSAGTDNNSLPRAQASEKLKTGVGNFLNAVTRKNLDLHSLMIVQDGKVVAEHYRGEGAPNRSHVMWSVSKTFTATAVGFAVEEHKLSLKDKVIDFFPEQLPDTVSRNLRRMTIRDLLTMTTGHTSDPTYTIGLDSIPAHDVNWIEAFMDTPVKAKPGTYFLYNTLGTYVLSAIMQKVTGEKIVDYLTPRLFTPLGIEKPYWGESPQGINKGGWGLYLKTEDMAKMGVLFLNEGLFNGHRIISSDWIRKASGRRVSSIPGDYDYKKVISRAETPEQKKREREKFERDNWLKGYGFQMWRGCHNTYRADGMRGQFIIVIPEKKAVVVTTANIDDMPLEINLIWDYILPEL